MNLTDEQIKIYQAKIKGAWYIKKFAKNYNYDLRKPEDKVKMYQSLDPKQIKLYFDDLMDNYDHEFMTKLSKMSNDELLKKFQALQFDNYVDI
ncbi:hypothetical protein MOO46_06500 [Apilactobacillus apisilvae]|uniref:Uncharacterized protein n=1 Tax=Apilactobacillus apisilvae TaxID=2923364 RepID=A0ABY4PGD7_9LACO|nr:hypothetical protein [Apilactobacillus apisilvae]UQS84888.1 hypothetical protein MOO46_06500 [Apilactobacillus apisilvae]